MSTYTVQQVSDAPAGFINSAKVTLTTTRSPAAEDIYCLIQRIEGQNMYDFAWGTSSAKTVTFSFWVKTSTAGVYSARLGGGQSYVFNFTVNQSNTWEYKTITIPGSVAGTWPTDNTTGIDLLFSLGTGSTRRTPTPNQWLGGDFHGTTDAINFVTLTPGSTFQITGVQLEVGPTATPFEYRPIGTELALCQRYYETVDVLPTGVTYGPNGDTRGNSVSYKVTKRVTPTLNPTSTPITIISVGASGTGTNLNGSVPYNTTSQILLVNGIMGNIANIAAGTGGGIFAWADNTIRTVTADAEL